MNSKCHNFLMICSNEKSKKWQKQFSPKNSLLKIKETSADWYSSQKSNFKLGGKIYWSKIYFHFLNAIWLLLEFNISLFLDAINGIMINRKNRICCYLLRADYGVTQFENVKGNFFDESMNFYVFEFFILSINEICQKISKVFCIKMQIFCDNKMTCQKLLHKKTIFCYWWRNTIFE